MSNKDKETLMDKKVQEYLLNKIKSEYSENEDKEFDTLMALDRKIKLPPTVQAYTIGIIGALVLGFGMSLLMTDLPVTMGIASYKAVGVICGIIGIALCAINYPTYARFLDSRKKRYSSEILRMADKLSANK